MRTHAIRPMLKPEHITRIYVKKQSTTTQGLGADFANVLSLLHLYEMGLCSGVETNYGKTGNYYDPAWGENWWQYYFEPLKVGDPKNSTICEHASFVNGPISTLAATREENFALIEKYIKIRQPILDEIDYLTKNVFEKFSFVLGVFHRGTDKHIDAATMTYDEVGDRVENTLKMLPFLPNERALFVTSDEAQFIPYMENRFGSILYLKNKERSSNGQPIHFISSDRYQAGRYALIDCLLFSKTDLMLRMDSNLGQIATFFSPKTPEILMNKSYHETTPEKIARYKVLRDKAQKGYNIHPLIAHDPILC